MFWLKVQLDVICQYLCLVGPKFLCYSLEMWTAGRKTEIIIVSIPSRHKSSCKLSTWNLTWMAAEVEVHCLNLRWTSGTSLVFSFGPWGSLGAKALLLQSPWNASVLIWDLCVAQAGMVERLSQETERALQRLQQAQSPCAPEKNNLAYRSPLSWGMSGPPSCR